MINKIRHKIDLNPYVQCPINLAQYPHRIWGTPSIRDRKYGSRYKCVLCKIIQAKYLYHSYYSFINNNTINIGTRKTKAYNINNKSQCIKWSELRADFWIRVEITGVGYDVIEKAHPDADPTIEWKPDPGPPLKYYPNLDDRPNTK